MPFLRSPELPIIALQYVKRMRQPGAWAGAPLAAAFPGCACCLFLVTARSCLPPCFDTFGWCNRGGGCATGRSHTGQLVSSLAMLCCAAGHVELQVTALLLKVSFSI